MALEKMFSINQVAEKLSVSRRTILRMIDDGELTAYYVRCNIRILEKDIQKLLEESEIASLAEREG